MQTAAQWRSTLGLPVYGDITVNMRHSTSGTVLKIAKLSCSLG